MNICTISTIYKLQFNQASMGRPAVSRAFRLRFFSCVFLQSFTSFFSSKRDIYLTIRPIPKASAVCFVISFLFRPKTVFSSENSRAFYSKNTVFYRKECPNRVQSITARPDVVI